MKSEQGILYLFGFAIIAMLFVGVMVISGNGKSIGLQSIGGGTTVINQGGNVQQTDTVSQWSIRLSAMNGENTGTEYINPTVAVTSLTDSKSVGSTALTGGASETLVALALGKNLVQSGFNVYSLASNPASGAMGLSGAVQTINGISSDLSSVKFLKYPADIKSVAGNSSYPCFAVYTQNLGADNATALGGGIGATANICSQTLSTTSHAIAQNGQVQGYIDVQINATSARFSGGNGFYIIAAGGATTTPSMFTENDVTLYITTAPGDLVITKLAGCVDPNDPGNALSKAITNNAPAIACFKVSRGLRSADGTVRMYYSVKASGGNPGANDNILFDFVNIEPFVDSDGNIKIGTYNSGNTVQGQVVGALTVDLA